MKAKVLEFLQEAGLPEVRYNEAMRLYRDSEGKSVPAADYYSRAGFSAINLKNICYDLQKLHAISDVEIATIKSTKSESANANDNDDAEKAKIAKDKLDAAILALADYNPEETSYNDAKKIVIGLGLELPDMKGETIKVKLIEAKGLIIAGEVIDEHLSKIKEDLLGASETQANSDETKNIEVTGEEVITPSIKDLLEKATDAEKEGLTLRQRFPFLGADDCPDKLKVLVADMLTAWDNFKAAHSELLFVGYPAEGKQLFTDAEIFERAKEAIENFEKNHTIWDELEYYAKENKILGVHSIFADDVLKETVAKMAPAKLVTRRNTLRSYVSKENKKLKPDTDEAAAKKINKKIKEFTQELNLIVERLGE